MKFHLPFGIRTIDKNSTFISKSEYQELMSYATKRNVKLEGFKRFCGEIQLIKEFIDDVEIIAKDFPAILHGKKSLIIQLDEYAREGDFATTDRHMIAINSAIFVNREYLEAEYKMLSDLGKFVRGTNYKSIARHELGHIVANIYKIKPMQIAKQILPDKTDLEILEYVQNNISMYAADYKDGREFISECFSAYYSNIDNDFAKRYVELCKEYVKEEIV